MPHDAIELTRRWISSMVIGLNLCPFARAVFDAKRIRFIANDSSLTDELLEVLEVELRFLASADIEKVETTVIILTNAVPKFEKYLELVGEVEGLIEYLGLEGVIQLATFHPRYQFEGTAEDAVENYTNRSPFPLLHLLREESITRVASSPDELLEIPKRNIQVLNELGLEKVKAKLALIEAEAP